MIRAQHGLLERQSLEDSCLIADGEDMSGLCKPFVALLNSETDHLVDCPAPIFTRPGPASCSRSSTCTCSSGEDTSPLSLPWFLRFRRFSIQDRSFPDQYRAIERHALAFQRCQTSYESKSPRSWPSSPLLEG